MPLKKELDFIYPRAWHAVYEHGQWHEVAKKLGLRPHRVPPYYIPYLDSEEQKEFLEQQIDIYNDIRKKQKSFFKK